MTMTQVWAALLLVAAAHAQGTAASAAGVPQRNVRVQEEKAPAVEEGQVGLPSIATAPTAEEPLVVRLERETVALPQPLLAVPRGTKRTKNFYSAKIEVGEPKQEFRISFDLSGGTLVLPSRTCEDHICAEKQRYNKWVSSTAADVRADGKRADKTNRRILDRFRHRMGDRGVLDMHSVELGAGTLSGTFVRDRVCLHGKTAADAEVTRCFPVDFLTADQMHGTAFHSEPYDGTVGLGLLGMSLTRDFNFLSALRAGYEGDMSPSSFALKLVGGEAEGIAELTFGPMDDRHPLLHAAGPPVRWVPVAEPEEGRWQVAIRAIRVGNKKLELCGADASCRAALDYGTSLLVVPETLVERLEGALAVPQGGFGDGCQLPALQGLELELEGGTRLPLPAEDFVSHFGDASPTAGAKSAAGACQPRLVQAKQGVEALLGKDVFVLGESTLRRYQTFYDADGLKVGFGSLTSGAPRLSTGVKGEEEQQKKEGGIIILLQLGSHGSRLQASAMLWEWDE